MHNNDVVARQFSVRIRFRELGIVPLCNFSQENARERLGRKLELFGNVRDIDRVGTPGVGAPPSEPNRPISGIRLSSWWLTFKKIGKPRGEPV